MNALMEVDCPACSKPMRFKSNGGTRQVALTCPGCSHLFPVQLNPVQLDAAVASAEPVVATPLSAPVAPIDEFLTNTEYSRPIITTRSTGYAGASSGSGMSPLAIKMCAIALAGMLLLGFVGYLAYANLSSLDLTAMVSDSTSQSPGVLSDVPTVSSDPIAEENAARNLSSSVANGNFTPQTTSSPASSVLNSRGFKSSPPSSSTRPSTQVTEPQYGASKPTIDPVDAATSSKSGYPGEPSPTTISDRAGNQNLADVIERAEQSVVRIEVKSSHGDSLGSGFVVDDEGTLVTNCHVLAGAMSAVAYFPNGRQCVVTGTTHIDQSRDIVIAKITDRAAPPIAVAGSLPRKGEQVTALGAPHGLAFTATRGIISAVRPGAEIGPKHQGTWVQVDAALSPGNSGGPLINSAGEVVGMSTLASQGTAQNLNFGISGQDINQALAKARSANTLTLAAGVGKVEMHEEGGGSGGDGQIVSEAKISDESFATYISKGVDEFDELLKSLRNESTRLSLELKEMKRGETYIPPAFRQQDAAVARVTAPGQRTPKWYFLNANIKQAVVTRQLEKIKTFTRLKSDIRDRQDADSLVELLWNHGPRLDVRRNNSIGYVTDLLVVHAFNEHDVLVFLDETPYLLWAPSTAGMSGGEIWEGPVYVAGTATAALANGLTSSVTVLQLVSEKQLRAAIEKSLQLSDGFRTWSDHSGSFSVEAKLLGKDATNIVLQKRDGTILNVPKNKLSQSDHDHLGQ